jgi:hypothetical protein
MSLNPLLWLHLRISGSARSNVTIVAAYTAIVIIFTGVSYHVAALEAGPRAAPQVYARVNAVWLVIMTVAQGVFLLLLAPSAIRRAVQRDFESSMIESHCVSPMSNLKIVLGYLTGAPIQAFLLYALSLVFGSYFATRYALSPGLGGAIGLRATLSGWYLAQGCMLVLAATAGALVLLTSLATRGKGNIIGVLALIGVFGGWVGIAFVPGLALLAGVLSGGVLIGLLTSAKIGGDPFVIISAAVLQLVFGVILLAAACRKLRAPDRPLFSIPLGLVLLAVWGFALVAGMWVAPRHNWLFGEWSDYQVAQLTSSTAAFMLIALFPLTATAAELFRRDRAASFGEKKAGPSRSRLMLMPPVLGALSTLVLSLMLWAMADELATRTRIAFESWATWAAIISALVLSFWTDFNWFYHLAVRGGRIVVGLLIMLALLKGIPLLLDSAIKLFARELADIEWGGYGYLTALSPIGTLILAPEGGARLWVGLIFQAALAGGATLLGRRARRRLGRRATGANLSTAIIAGPSSTRNPRTSAPPTKQAEH